MSKALLILDFEDGLVPGFIQIAASLDLTPSVVPVGDLQGTRYACEPEAEAEIRRRLFPRLATQVGTQTTPTWTLIGSGDFHYVTLLLLEPISEPFTLVLFDGHSDAMEPAYAGSLLCCSSWVRRVLHLPNLQQVVICGARPETLLDLPVGPRPIVTFSDPEVLQKTLLPTEAIYISIDKDVLCPDDAQTNWSHGDLSLGALEAAVTALLSSHRLVGFDLCGEMRSHPGDFSFHVRNLTEKNRLANLRLLSCAMVSKKP